MLKKRIISFIMVIILVFNFIPLINLNEKVYAKNSKKTAEVTINEAKIVAINYIRDSVAD